MAVFRVFLVVCVLVMVGASADASASSTALGTWTLTVTFAGTGTGVVTSDPAGIVCTNENPSTLPGAVPQPLGACSAQFPDDISPWVIATPTGPVLGSTGSTYTDISGACGPETHAGVLDNRCQANPGNGPAEVTFTMRPVPCIVDRVVGDTLTRAKLHLSKIQCKVGTVRYAYDSRAKKGLVISQDPKPGWIRQ